MRAHRRRTARGRLRERRASLAVAGKGGGGCCCGVGATAPATGGGGPRPPRAAPAAAQPMRCASVRALSCDDQRCRVSASRLGAPPASQRRRDSGQQSRLDPKPNVTGRYQQPRVIINVDRRSTVRLSNAHTSTTWFCYSLRTDERDKARGSGEGQRAAQPKGQSQTVRYHLRLSDTVRYRPVLDPSNGAPCMAHAGMHVRAMYM